MSPNSYTHISVYCSILRFGNICLQFKADNEKLGQLLTLIMHMMLKVDQQQMCNLTDNIVYYLNNQTKYQNTKAVLRYLRIFFKDIFIYKSPDINVFIVSTQN